MFMLIIYKLSVKLHAGALIYYSGSPHDAVSICLVLEVKKKGNQPMEFPPNTLYHICCGIQRYLRWNGKSDIDFQ